MHWWSLSVCLVLDPQSRTVGRSKLKIDRKENEARDTGNLQPHYEVERRKVKVTKPLNVVTKNQLYIFEMGRPTNLKLGTRMEYKDPRHRHVRWPPTWQLLVAVQVAICTGRSVLWRLHYRPYSSCLCWTVDVLINQSINQFICIRPHGSISH